MTDDALVEGGVSRPVRAENRCGIAKLESLAFVGFLSENGGSIVVK